MKRILLFSALAVSLGCAHETPVEHKQEAAAAQAAGAPSIEAKQIAAAEQAPYVTEVKFHKGAHEVTKPTRKAIQKLIEDAQAHGTIEDVKVISWADEEYPSVHAKKLASGQVKLADQRAGEIKAYIHSLDSKTSVDTYNMAKRPAALSELFSTGDARIKKALEVSGIPNTDTSVKAPAKASKSIVLVILKE
jgi:hypothetical protein